MFESSKYARQFGRNAAPEDMLMIISHAPGCMGARVLEARGISPEAVRHEVQVETEKAGKADIDKPLAAMAGVLEESKILKLKLVGTECMLLGLFYVKDSIVERALRNLGLGLDDTRETVRELFSRDDFVYPEKAKESRP